MIRIIILFALFVFYNGIFLFGQPENIKFQNFQIQNGLAGSRINCLLVDIKGYLWIGTNDGLNKYDAYHFTTYRHNQSDSLTISDNYIKAIFEDNNKTLWVCTVSDISYYDRKKDVFVPIKLKALATDLKNIAISSGISDKFGNIWLTTKGNGLIKFNKQKKALEKFNYSPANKNCIPSNYLFSICKDNHSKIWVGADSGLINFEQKSSLYPKFRKILFKNLELTNIGSLNVDNNGNIWVGCLDRGILYINPVTGKQKLYDTKNSNLSNHNPYSFLQDRDGDIWIGTVNGLNLLRFSEEKFINIYNNPLRPGTLSDNSVWSMLQDKSGVIWLGTSKGLNRYNKQLEQFRNFEINTNNGKSLINNYIQAFCEESDSVFWIGTKGGLEKFNCKLGTFKHQSFSKDKNNTGTTTEIRSLAKDKSGNLWIGTWGYGLYKYNVISGEIKNFRRAVQKPDSIPGNFIRKVYFDKSDELWIGTTEGLAHLNIKTEKFTNYFPNENNQTSISGRDIFQIFEDSKNNLWVGTLFYGLNKFDRKTGKCIHYLNKQSDKQSISNDAVLSIAESSDGSLWIGTRIGLNKFDQSRGKFVSFNINDGLPNDAILAIIEDKQGYLWISTNAGISKFDTKHRKFKNYYKKDGLQNDEFNSNSYLNTTSGDIIFGGPTGFNIFNPDKIKENLYFPNIVLTDFKLFNIPVKQNEIINGNTILTNSIAETEQIDLSYKNDVFSIDFSALDFTAPEFNKYSYKLEGFDKDWIVTSADRRFVTYTNLDGGKYLFKVKCTNSSGIWNENYKTLRIIVHPPFWLTWWFKILVLLLIVGVSILVITQRIRNINKQKEMLEKLVTERTIEIHHKNEEIVTQNEQLAELNATKDKFFGIIAHDLKNPFNSILGFSEILSEDIEIYDKPTIAKFAKNIHVSSEYAFKLLENLLEWSSAQTGKINFRPEKFEFEILLDEVISLSEDMALAKNITITKNIADHLLIIADRNMIHTILRNLITNAVKFTHKNGNITIVALNLDNEIKITVSDTGVGIDNETKSKIFKISEKVSTLGTEEEKGTGLGLLLCKEFIDKHGGKIWIESETGKGSNFTFSIPFGRL